MTEDIIFAKPLECYVKVEYKEDTDKLSSIKFLKIKENLKERKTREITLELERYFEGEKIDFSGELDISGLSLFAQKVLEETRKIGYGRTITYAELARAAGTSPRAAGRALSINPIPIVIPCHRVVAKNGLGGYSAGLDIKTRLLELEKSNNL